MYLSRMGIEWGASEIAVEARGDLVALIEYCYDSTCQIFANIFGAKPLE